MRLKTGLNLSKNYSYNFSLPKRGRKYIKFIILHYTGMKKESSALRRLCNKKSKVSAHYFIKENGKVINLVPDLYEAWHAGKSHWKNFKSINKYSIGIEISNPGHDNGYKNFSSKQILSITKLIKFLISKYHIKYSNILGHSDISPDRKKDPGEKFPWKKLSKNKLACWHNLDEYKLKKFRCVKIPLNDELECLKNLSKIGYYGIKLSSRNHKNKIITKAFQRKYRQSLINGKIDKECFLISKNLIKQ